MHAARVARRGVIGTRTICNGILRARGRIIGSCMAIGIANKLTAARIHSYRFSLATTRLAKNPVTGLVIISIAARRTIRAGAIGIIWIAALWRIIIIGIIVALFCAVIIFGICPRLAEGELVLEFI